MYREAGLHIQTGEHQMKRMTFALLFALLVLAAFPTVALADNVPPPTPPGTLDPGIDRYLAVLDIADIPALAQNGSGASSGAFGYFGKDLNLGIKTDPIDPGANGYQTGINNSGVAGNRQGNLP
jgi:hypothetical protein